MSVKFEIAGWSFELTWKELICQPIEDKKTGARTPQWKQALTDAADGELLPAESFSSNYGREQAVSL